MKCGFDRCSRRLRTEFTLSAGFCMEHGPSERNKLCRDCDNEFTFKASERSRVLCDEPTNLLDLSTLSKGW